MGKTYETDRINDDQEIRLALQSAILVRALGHLIGCRSWLTARLSMHEVREAVQNLEKIVDAGSK